MSFVSYQITNTLSDIQKIVDFFPVSANKRREQLETRNLIFENTKTAVRDGHRS